MTPEEIVREIMKDLVFYQGSGGFTFSGGEPLYQPEFVLDVFRLCASHDVRGTLETCLSIPWENIEPLIPYLKSIFVDIKHMSPEKHKEVTGRDNALIFDNLTRLDNVGSLKLVIRFPFVPGLNDSDENIELLAVFCKTLKHLDFAEILPYHRLGTDKYRQLCLSEPLPEVIPPEHENVMTLAKKLSSAGNIKVKAEGKLILA
jgi:pyruvate formate lyase activating enzyme